MGSGPMSSADLSQSRTFILRYAVLGRITVGGMPLIVRLYRGGMLMVVTGIGHACCRRERQQQRDCEKASPNHGSAPGSFRSTSCALHPMSSVVMPARLQIHADVKARWPALLRSRRSEGCNPPRRSFKFANRSATERMELRVSGLMFDRPTDDECPSDGGMPSAGPLPRTFPPQAAAITGRGRAPELRHLLPAVAPRDDFPRLHGYRSARTDALDAAQSLRIAANRVPLFGRYPRFPLLRRLAAINGAPFRSRSIAALAKELSV